MRGVHYGAARRNEMPTPTYDNDPDRPDDGPSAYPERFSEHTFTEAQRAAIPHTMGTDAEAEAFIRINTKRNRERAAYWLERWGIEP